MQFNSEHYGWCYDLDVSENFDAFETFVAELVS
jgi:hypothetical protein